MRGGGCRIALGRICGARARHYCHEAMGGGLMDKWEMGRYAEAHKQQMWGKGFLRFFVLWGLGYGD